MFEFAACNGLDALVESRTAADDENTARIRLQPQCYVEGRREGSFQNDASDIGRERVCLEVEQVRSAKHDRHAWKEGLGVRQQKIEGRLHDRDNQVQLPPAVIAAKELEQGVLIARAVELRESQRLAVELDGPWRLSTQHFLEVAIDDGKAGQVLVLVEHEKYLRFCVCRSGQRPHGERESERALPTLCAHVGRHVSTLSASATRSSGSVRPIAAAAFLFRCNKYGSGCCTGMSPGFLPLMIWSAMRAPMRYCSR